jgi:hypothetical protein
MSIFPNHLNSLFEVIELRKEYLMNQGLKRPKMSVHQLDFSVNLALSELGCPRPAGERRTSEEAAAAREFRKQLPVSTMADLLTLFDQAAKKHRAAWPQPTYRTNRATLQRLVTWYEEEVLGVEQEKPTYCPPIRTGRGRPRDIRLTQRTFTSSSPLWRYALVDASLETTLMEELKAYFERSTASKSEFDRLYEEVQAFFIELPLSEDLQTMLELLADDPTISSELKRAVNHFFAKHEIRPELQRQMNAMSSFLGDVTGQRYRQNEAKRPRSLKSTMEEVRRHLGYLHRIKGIPLSELSLELLVPHSGIASGGGWDEVALDDLHDAVAEQMRWLREERQASPNCEQSVIKARIDVGKFLYAKLSRMRGRHQQSRKTVSYRDIPVIEELRAMDREVAARIRVTPKVADESKKLIDWPTYRAAVARLEQECGTHYADRKPRKPTDVSKSVQIFLITLIYSVCPDRARTIYELELGRRLLKTDTGQYQIVHHAGDFKTGDSYCQQGESRIIPFPEEFSPYFDAWFETHRQRFNPNHGFVFTQWNGKPVSDNSLYHYFRRRMYRLTGKLFHPHLVRDAAVTYFKGANVPEQVLDSLAHLMAHSREMQSRVYDRRTSQQKVMPAIEALYNAPVGELPPLPGQK